MDIEANLNIYLGERDPAARYASFDYCFNHFQAHRDRPADLMSPDRFEKSCLQLGFYLASWGMLRASSDLLQRSVRHYRPVIEAIASVAPEVWTTDAHNYGGDTIRLLQETAIQLRSALGGHASNTLVTKIMLGVFGCVPAFDSFFRKGFRVSTFGWRSLAQIGEFYADNAELIDKYRVPTIGFDTGTHTKLRYTRAKVIDMIFFIEGGYTGARRAGA